MISWPPLCGGILLLHTVCCAHVNLHPGYTIELYVIVSTFNATLSWSCTLIRSLYLLVLSFLASTHPKRLWTLPSQADGAVLERETWSTLHMYRIYPTWQGYVTLFIQWKCCLCEALEVHWVLPLAVTWLHSSIDFPECYSGSYILLGSYTIAIPKTFWWQNLSDVWKASKPTGWASAWYKAR